MKIDRDFIAEKAGVSTATVSRVFNDPDSVSPDKVKLVLDAARKYGYSPNKMASALRRNETGIITFLELENKYSGKGNKYYHYMYADAIRGVKRATDSSMFNLNLASIERSKLGALGEKKQSDGIIAYDIFDRNNLSAIRSSGIPYISVYRKAPAEFNCIYMDDQAGSRIAGLKFIERGLSKPAHITGDPEFFINKHRWDGFRSAFSREPVLITGEMGIKGGYESGKKAAAEIKAGRIDCIFFVNDITAIGALQALLESKIRVPEDVSLIGYDNMPAIDSLPVGLATIDLPMFTMFSKVTEKLIDLIKHGGNVHEGFTPEFVDGESLRQLKMKNIK